MHRERDSQQNLGAGEIFSRRGVGEKDPQQPGPQNNWIRKEDREFYKGSGGRNDARGCMERGSDT